MALIFFFFSKKYDVFKKQNITTVEVLKTTLAPFTDVEEVSGMLGIPIDARGNPITSGPQDHRKVDPRSQEFKNILVRLSKAMKFLKGRPEFLDSERYIKWLYQLQHRATSLVARSMRELMESAAKMCQDVYVKNKQVRSDESPLESSPVYQKFRGLSFRMKELYTLLRDQIREDQSVGSDSDQPGQQALTEIMNMYVVLRNSVLLPILRDCMVAMLASSQGASMDKPESKSSSSNGQNLCSGIRQAYSVLLRLSQLEHQLYDSLFKSTTAAADEETNERDQPSSGSEVLSIVDTLCGATSDVLRPIIIHEPNVDELCRVINTLAEDVRTQMLTVSLPKPTLRSLLLGLDLTVSDAQERLSYCAELKLRQDVQMFEPTGSHLAYPDILQLEKATTSEASAPSPGGSVAQRGMDDVSRTWCDSIICRNNTTTHIVRTVVA